MKILATTRLRSATIVKEGYSEKSGAEELQRLTDFKKQHSSKCELLGVKGDLHFYWMTGNPYGGADIVCMVNDVAVGTVHVSRRRIEIEENGKSEDVVCAQPSSFISAPYRGKGIVFGMYQYLISKYNLITDDRQSRDSFNLWKRLAKMYPTKVLTDIKYGLAYREDPEANLTLKTTRLLIMRHP